MMMHELLQKLIELYKSDVEDYDSLLEKMQAFNDFLESKSDQLPIETYVDKLKEFTLFRNDCFRILQQRSLQSTEIKKQLMAKTGRDFQIEDFKPYLAQKDFSLISDLSQKLPQKMKRVLELDELIISKLNSELENVREELNRLQKAQKLKHIYRSKELIDARFIDKTK